MTVSAQPYLVVLKEGPSHSLEDIQPHCAVLAMRFRGELWTYGGYDADCSVGGMKLRVVNQGTRSKLSSYLQFWREVMKSFRAEARAPWANNRCILRPVQDRLSRNGSPAP